MMSPVLKEFSTAPGTTVFATTATPEYCRRPESKGRTLASTVAGRKNRQPTVLLKHATRDNPFRLRLISASFVARTDVFQNGGL